MTIALDVRLRVIELRKQGYTYVAIAEMTGVGAYSICEKAGLTGMGHGHLGRKGKHTKEEKQIALNLREEGYTIAAISEITGMAIHNITNYCTKAGVKPTRYSEEEKQKVVGLRKEGYVCRAISEMTDVKLHYVRIICQDVATGKAYGHLGRKKSCNPFDDRNEKIRELREQGLTLKEIGGMYKITRERVRQLCEGVKKPDLRERVNCRVCETEYIRAERNSKYCGDECRKKGLSELWRQKNAKFSLHATIELICTGCGVKFERANRLEGIAECGRKTKGKKDTGRRFCSKECYWKNGVTERHDRVYVTSLISKINLERSADGA